MSIFVAYLKLFVPTTLVAISMLRFYAMQYLYRTPEKFWPGMPTTLGATVVIALITLIVVKIITNPFDQLLKKIQKGYEPTSDERLSALKIYKKVNFVTLGANVLGFFVGQVAVLIIEVSSGVTEYHIQRILFSVVQAVLTGGMSAICAIFVFNEMIAPLRRMLKIQDIKGFSKTGNMSVSATVITVFIISMLFMCCNTLSVSFELINVQKTAPVQDAMGIYLRSGILSFVITFLPAFFILLVVLRGLRLRVKSTTELVHDIADKGDLTSRIDITMVDDFGGLIASVNALMNQLSAMIITLRKQTEVVSNSASVLEHVSNSVTNAVSEMDKTRNRIEIENQKQTELIVAADKDISGLYNGVKTVEQHVQEQSSSVQQSSASITEMAANITSVADLTKKADTLSNDLSDITEKGSASIASAINSIVEIQTASREVQDIVKVIQKIASQTNLLSMNAAIEAAHAGEFGAGFAVVANEVRSLAASSATSAKEIQKHIQEMVQKIDGGVQAIDQAGEAFKGIATNVDQNSSLIQTISRAMDEQQVGAHETMEATAELVEAIQAVRELASKQSLYAENIMKMMENVVSSSKQVGEAIFENSNSSNNLVNSIKRVEETVQSNGEAVLTMKESIGKYAV